MSRRVDELMNDGLFRAIVSMNRGRWEQGSVRHLSI